WIVSDWFDGAPYERPLVFGLCALAFVAVPTAVIGGIATWSDTTLLPPPPGPLPALLPAGLLVGPALAPGGRAFRPCRMFERQPVLALFVGGLAAALIAMSTALSLMYPPTGYDALSYHGPLAVLLWRDGNLTTFLARAPAGHALANPGTVQLWY